MIPDPPDIASTAEDYDVYFGIARETPDLLEWTRTCLSVQERLLGDLHKTTLSAEDRCDILNGLLTVVRVTLGRWIAAADRIPKSS